MRRILKAKSTSFGRPDKRERVSLDRPTSVSVGEGGRKMGGEMEGGRERERVNDSSLCFACRIWHRPMYSVQKRGRKGGREGGREGGRDRHNVHSTLLHRAFK